ncbi:hypothetical protein ACH5RR_008254 [Cinchona calisaya]|uniref:BRCA1-associated 2/ETP1 RRM domain-containing protein n=1 Tax=Cinchona calisaya TaxID=153742 RepID=A0ABD3AEP0_9GENT
MEDNYSVMIRLDDQSSTDNFYKHFSGKRFSSLEVEICHVLFTVNVQFIGLIEHAQAFAIVNEYNELLTKLENQKMGEEDFEIEGEEDTRIGGRAERFDDCFEIGNAVEPSATSDESINGKTLLPAESSSKNSGKGATTSIPRSH